MSDLNELWANTAVPEKQKFDLLPKGVYQAQITDAVLDSTNGKDHIKFEFTITEGPYQNRKVWKRWYLTSKVLPYLKGQFEAVGMMPENIEDIPRVLNDLYLKHVEIYVSVQEAQGQYPAKNEARINGLIDKPSGTDPNEEHPGELPF